MTNHDKLYALACAATQGEWTIRNDSIDDDDDPTEFMWMVDAPEGREPPYDTIALYLLEQDAAFIAACNPQAIKSLIDNVNRTCEWTKYDADNCGYNNCWSTSCGEDFSILHEWHEDAAKFCQNCGGKVVEPPQENDS